MIDSTPSGFKLFQGCDDLLFASLTLGAAGGIAATGNVAPKLVVDLYNAFVDQDWERSRAAQKKLTALRRAFLAGAPIRP